MPSVPIHSHSWSVSAPLPTYHTAASRRAHEMTAAVTIRSHCPHSCLARSQLPESGGLTGFGPPAKRCAKRASAQRTMLGPNAIEKPRYTAARPCTDLGSAPLRRSMAVATSSTRSTSGVAIRSAALVRCARKTYRATKPETSNTQKPTSQATMNPTITRFPLERSRGEKIAGYCAHSAESLYNERPKSYYKVDLMPKIDDHNQRRLDIEDAVLEGVASEGVERLTVRKIAAVSGWSTGVLAHYARDKDDMIDLAVTSMVTRFAVRLQAIDTSDTRRALRDVLAELLPLDATRRTEAMAWARLATHDADGSGSARDVREGHRELRRHVASLLADIDEGHDPSVTATELIALADGLAVHHLIDPHGMPRTRIEATLDARLAQI